jgi:hypothetical protein
MAIFDKVVGNSINFKGYTGNPPTTEAEYLTLDCWTDASIAPTWASISTEMAVLEVQENRRPEYPAIGDQLDMLFHAIEAGTLDTTSEFFTTLKAVKDANPKA